MEKLKRVMAGLEARGFEVKAQLVNSEAFDQAILELGELESGYEVLLDGKATRNPGFLRRIFGLSEALKPLEMTFLAPPDKMNDLEKQILVETAAIHQAVLLLGMALSEKSSALASGFLSSYFYTYFTNLRSILRFKSQGKVLVVSKDPETNQEFVQLEAAPSMVLAANFAEELAANGPMSALITGKLDPVKVGEMSAVLGFGKLLVERYAATMEAHQKRAEQRGEMDLAKRIEKRRFFIMRIFYNGFVPIVRTVLTFAKESPSETVQAACNYAEAGIFGAVGCVALGQEVVRATKLHNAVHRAGSEHACSRMIVSGLIEKELKERESVVSN